PPEPRRPANRPWSAVPSAPRSFRRPPHAVTPPPPRDRAPTKTTEGLFLMTTPTSAPALPGRVLAVAVCSAFLVGLDSMITVPLIPEIAADTNTAARAGGLFVSAY